MTEQTTCLSELAVKGMRRMEELHIAQSHFDVFAYEKNQFVGCCVLGALLIGAGIEPDTRMDTASAIDWLAEICPAVQLEANPYMVEVEDSDESTVVGDILWRLNDGGWYLDKAPKSIPEIIMWLEANHL